MASGLLSADFRAATCFWISPLVNSPDHDDRVVITGIGLVTGLGLDRESTWKSLLAGAGAVRRLEPGDFAEIPQGMIEPGRFLGAPAKLLSSTSSENIFCQEPNIQLAIQAANEAVEEARIDWNNIDPFRRGCVIGTSKGGMVVAIQKELGLPIKFIGLGEQPDDLQPFDAKRFAQALFEE